MNVGYKEALKDDDYDCFIFHDVDLILEDDRAQYGCSQTTSYHLSILIDKFGYRRGTSRFGKFVKQGLREKMPQP